MEKDSLNTPNEFLQKKKEEIAAQKAFEADFMRGQEIEAEEDDEKEQEEAQRRLREEEEEDFLEEEKNQDEEQQALNRQILEDEMAENGVEYGPNDSSVLLQEEALSFLQENGQEISGEDLDELKENPIEESRFPLGMFMLALIKDTFDVLVSLTLILSPVATMFGFIYFPIAVSWTYSRMNRLGFAQKFVIKKVLRRVFMSSAAELIPGLNILPFATLFLLLNHYSETKMVRLFLQAVEIMKKV